MGKPIAEWTDEEIVKRLERLTACGAGNGMEADAYREILRLRKDLATRQRNDALLIAVLVRWLGGDVTVTRREIVTEAGTLTTTRDAEGSGMRIRVRP